MSERVRRDNGRSLYPWNVTAGRYCYLGHTCLCSDDVTATWSTGAGRQRPSVIVYRSVRVVGSRVVADCYCSYCVCHGGLPMDSFALIDGESDSGLSLSVSVTIPLMSVSISFSL